MTEKFWEKPLETLDRAELQALLADVAPESYASETIGTVRALPMRD